MTKKNLYSMIILFLFFGVSSLFGGSTLIMGFHANMSNWGWSDSGIPANINRQLSVTTGSTMYGTSGASIEATPGGYVVYSAGWDGNSETKGWVFPMTTSKYGTLTLTFYQKSRAQNVGVWEYGPKNFKLQYSTDNSTWTDVAGANFVLTSSWQRFSATLPAECNNQPTLYLKWVRSTTTSINNGAIAPGALSDFADFYLYGDEIPLPITNINLSNSSIKANVLAGTAVGNLTAVDENTVNTHTFTLVSGDGDTDNGSFSIDGNTLKVNSSLSVRSYSVRINAYDGTFNYAKSFTITSDMLAPTDIALTNRNVSASAAIGTVIGTLSATDPNGGVITYTYTLAAGEGSTNNDLFTITGTSLKTNSSLSLGSYSIRINVSNGYRDYAKVFTINATPPAVIWTGPKATFTKVDNADWTLPENQDRISPLVWITRGNSQPIFNIKSESSVTGSKCFITSPAGTEWAMGTTADYNTLAYNNFISTSGCYPTEIVGKNMVLHLIDENIYIDIKFLSWNTGAGSEVPAGGGFSYERSTDPSLPVELTSFYGKMENGKVALCWQTATEVNNYGFEIQRSLVTGHQSFVNWEKIGFVSGAGNSNSLKEYSFIDVNPPAGELQYRLKQIDLNGAYKYYTETAEVNYGITGVQENHLPKEFSLSQNYPNPFNPVTVINYQLPVKGHVKLKVFDLLGKEITTLVNEVKNPGYYSARFDGSNLLSGMYIYRLTANSLETGEQFIKSAKMMLIK